MKKILFMFFLLLVAIGLGFLIHLDSGYILISYHDWTIETSLWVGIFVMVLFLLLLQLVFHVVRMTAHMGKNVKKWGSERSQKKGQRQTNIGLCELAEGNWKKAESILIKSAQAVLHPFINYLSAARAAQAQGAYESRDAYLKLAHEAKGATEMAVGLTQAQLQIEAKQWEQAIATLQHLNQIDKGHAHVLHLLHKVYMEMNDWPALKTILTGIRKAKMLSKDELAELEQLVYFRLLEQDSLSCDEAQAIWKDVPSALHIQPKLVAAYVKKIMHKHVKLAVSILEAALAKKWDSSLVYLFGVVATRDDDPKRAFLKAEKWLQKHPRDPELLLCLAKLSISQKFWGQAKHYLEACAGLLDRQDVYQELGYVMQALGENDKALSYYKKGLEVS